MTAAPARHRILQPIQIRLPDAQLATLYGLEDIQGFDPLIYLRYEALFRDNRAPINDPIRNLDIARPEAALFDLLGVRYLVGNPFDRRLTTVPQTLVAAAPFAPVEAWSAAPAPGRSRAGISSPCSTTRSTCRAGRKSPG